MQQRLDRLADAVGYRGSPLSRRDHPRWAAARTLDDLGELTALWLQGRIDSQPGYYGRVDVDEQDAPGLTRALVAANRAGYLTFDSQAGWVARSSVGSLWLRYAHVHGFATPAVYDQLRAVLAYTGFVFYAWPCKPRWRRRLRPPVEYGWQQLGEKDIAFKYQRCHGQAIDALCDALQVHIHDPVPGRNTLWPVLHRAARRGRLATSGGR